MNTTSRRAARIAGATVGAAGLLALSAGLASAHVTVTPSTTAAESYSVLTFAVGHGCEESPTTSIAIRLPESIIAVSPTINPGWNVEKTMEKLGVPVDDGHGGQYTERVAEVVYTAKTPLPDGFRDTFALSLQLPDAAGDMLTFPVIQTCEKGETAWIETVAEGEDEPAHPAPFITLTAAEAGDHHGATSDDEAPADDHDGASSDEGSNSNAIAWTGVGVGALGLALGAVALARSGRRS